MKFVYVFDTRGERERRSVGFMEDNTLGMIEKGKLIPYNLPVEGISTQPMHFPGDTLYVVGLQQPGGCYLPTSYSLFYSFDKAKERVAWKNRNSPSNEAVFTLHPARKVAPLPHNDKQGESCVGGYYQDKKCTRCGTEC